jgi:hypothetical protein
MNRRRPDGNRSANVAELDGIALDANVSCRSVTTSYRGSFSSSASFGRSSYEGTVDAYVELESRGSSVKKGVVKDSFVFSVIAIRRLCSVGAVLLEWSDSAVLDAVLD